VNPTIRSAGLVSIFGCFRLRPTIYGGISMTSKLRLLTAALLLSAAPVFAQAPDDVDVLTPGAEAGDTIGAHGFKITYEETAVEGIDEVRDLLQRDGNFQEVFDEVAAQIALPRDVP